MCHDPGERPWHTHHAARAVRRRVGLRPNTIPRIVGTSVATRPTWRRLRPYSGPLRQAHQILHGAYAEFAHHPAAMDLDRLFHRAEIAGDLLVEPSGHHVGEHL